MSSIWVEPSFGRYEVMDGSAVSIKRLVLPASAGLPRVGHPSAVAFTSCCFLMSYSSGMMTPYRKYWN
ncbi:MAG: hypothetical protein ACK5N9_25015, partial [Pirellula sp.]